MARQNRLLRYRIRILYRNESTTGEEQHAPHHRCTCLPEASHLLFLWKPMLLSYGYLHSARNTMKTLPLRHCVRLTFCRLSTNRTSCIYPAFDSRKWRFSCSCRFIRIYFRQRQWKLIFRYWNCSTIRTMYNRDWLSPVTLRENTQSRNL